MNYFTPRTKNTAVFILLLFAFTLSVGLSGCAQLSNPIAVAETNEQKAFALFGEYVVFKELAADIMEDVRVPVDVRRKIRNANNRVTPVARTLRDAALEVERIRMQVEAGTNTSERLDIVTANLVRYLDTSSHDSAASLIQALIDALRDAR